MVMAAQAREHGTSPGAGLWYRVNSLVTRSRPSLRFGRLEAVFLALVLAALALRLFELGGRTMHYDEAIHVQAAYRLANDGGTLWGWPWIFGANFIHAPWMHGTFQVELTALIFRLFGDSDVTARLGYVLFGTALVGLPYFLRDYLGRAAALVAGVMLALSPTLLYFSRFGRNDIIMAFWATALLVLMWRYLQEGRDRYLYMASAVLAFMFATKETAYLVVLIFGAMMFLLALPDLVPWALGRARTSQLAGAAGFLLLLFTLTLPQWSALASLVLDPLGLNLTNPQDVNTGSVGAPQWDGPLVILPVYEFAAFLHAIAALLLVVGLELIAWRQGLTARVFASGVGAPLAVVAATALAVFRPLEGPLSWQDVPVADFTLAGLLALAAVVTLMLLRHPWKRGALLLTVPALLALVYSALFTNVVNVDAVVRWILPTGISVDASANGIPVNYVVAGSILLGTAIISIFLGMNWRGGVWLTCAAIFYVIWIALFTTCFTNMAGFLSGIWQGMGYWIAQQDVARGNQPWYYYFVGLPVYEILPVVFGLVGTVYFLRKWDILGLALAFWAGLTLLAYTMASEKMPWLLVNVSLPFILLAAKYLGELVERVPWRRALRRGHVALLVFPPLAIVAAVYVLYSYVEDDPEWLFLFSIVSLALVSAYLIRLAHPRVGVALLGLGVAVLLLGFGTESARRAAYTYDDSNKEILAYAQGSADLLGTFRSLDKNVFQNRPEAGAVRVDYDLSYPFQWYVRDQQAQDILTFACFKEESEEHWDSGCNPVPEESESRAYLLNFTHGNRDAEILSQYDREGPLRNLLWFPESYRRPGENRPAEGFLWGFRGIPTKEQLRLDFKYFKSVASSRKSWSDTLKYLIFRDLEQEWYHSDYYSYLSNESRTDAGAP